MIDDYRILWVTKPSRRGGDALLVLWDTSGPQSRQSVFGMASTIKPDVAYVPERLISSASVQSGIGLHRADPNQRIVGVVCRGPCRKDQLHDSYMIIISTADLCAHGSTQTVDEHKIRWEKWQSSATIVGINLAITTTACISGSRFFAALRGVSYTAYAALFRVYDFSPGARGRRWPNRPPVRDHIVNAARVLKKVDNATWEFSEDNLLMFNVSAG